MATDKFRAGHVYYQCGHPADPACEPVISSWVYEGFVNRPKVNSLSCDVPFHFYAFIEWNGWLAKSQGEADPCPQTLYIPSADQANDSMLTWQELADWVREINDELEK